MASPSSPWPATYPILTTAEPLIDHRVQLARRASRAPRGEASINRLTGQQAARVIVVADSSKVGRRAFARICTIGEIEWGAAVLSAAITAVLTRAG